MRVIFEKLGIVFRLSKSFNQFSIPGFRLANPLFMEEKINNSGLFTKGHWAC